MEDLRKLVQIVTNRGQKTHPLLETKSKYLAKETDLFLRIKKGQLLTDEDAAAALYKCKPNDPRLKMLKSRLRKKLLNHLFFLDFSDSRLKVSVRYEQECLSLLHQGRTLMNEGEHKISAKLLQHALKLATEAEFTSIIISCLELLLINYSLTVKSNLYYKTKKTLEHYRKLAAFEHEAEDLYYTAKLEQNKSVLAKRGFLPKLQKSLERLKELWEATQSANIFEYFYILDITKQELYGNFEEILKITTTSEKLLQQGKINQKRFDIRYNIFITVYAYLRVKDYQSGLAFAEANVNAFNRSTNNWFAFMENYMLLAMHAGKYDLAVKIFEDVSDNSFFKKIRENAQERWTLYRSYLYFVNPTKNLLRPASFKQQISSIPEYSKDKQGFNVAIMILQFLYHVRAKDTDVLGYLIESLKKYAGRHLRENFSKRSLYFFKLLVVVVNANLDYQEALKKGKTYYERLQDTPEPGDAFAEIEIIPYEQLWQILLNILQELEE
ncbi:MAG: hypothetical protein ACO1OF_17315 [Adhaeribacter sp.]